MALSPQLRNFCDSWRGKAAAYSLDDLGDAFDRFFTSYVVFNRLYVEATHRLARRGAVRLERSLRFCGLRFYSWKALSKRYSVNLTAWMIK